MCEESEIIEVKEGTMDPSLLFTDPQMIFSNSKNVLYRVTRQGKYFIIKVGRNAYSRSLLEREYELSVNLVHPHLVNVWGFEYDTPVGPGLVMEYINGRTLTDYLLENPSRKEKERIFGQILSVVSYIHHAGLVHNDLKPDNILVSYSDNDIKLIDFGLSDNDTHAFGKSLGMSPQYASPELQSRDGLIDSRSDIFSVGQIMKDIFGRRFSGISEKATRTLPERRYASIDALASRWKKRYLSLYLIMVSILIIMFSVPTAVSFHEHGTLVSLRQTIREKEEKTDSLAQVMDEKLGQRYEMAADSISQAPDERTRIMCLNHYLEYSWRLVDSLHAEIDDVEVAARIDAFCNQLRNKHQKALIAVLDGE